MLDVSGARLLGPAGAGSGPPEAPAAPQSSDDLWIRQIADGGLEEEL